MAFSIVIRTKFLDDLLQQACASGVRQVVLLGAGMDSRAFRMDWPEGTRLFEADTAAPLDFKASALRRERAVARCEPITVAVDLREDWPGFRGLARLPGRRVRQPLVLLLRRPELHRPPAPVEPSALPVHGLRHLGVPGEDEFLGEHRQAHGLGDGVFAVLGSLRRVD